MGDKAGRWLRVSTGGQDEANQVPAVTGWVESHGYDASRAPYVVHGGSAFKGNKKFDETWEQVLADMRAGVIGVLVVWKSDRIDRKLNMLRMLAEVAEAGGRVEFVTDNPSLVLQAAQRVSQAGYAPTGAVLAPGWQYRSSAARTQQLVQNPVGSVTPFAANLAGLGMMYDPLRWNGNADAVIGQWSNAVTGVRRDITLKLFDTGIISNDDGTLAYNLLQQDMVALRATVRVGFLVVNPPTDSSYTGTPNSFSIVYNTNTPGVVGVSEPAQAKAPVSGRSRR